MKIDIYQRSDETAWCKIEAFLEKERLRISGHDIGPTVEDFFGSQDYEYVITLEEKSTKRLFESLGCADMSEEDKLKNLKKSFSPSKITSELAKYCKDHDIEFSFWCWP